MFKARLTFQDKEASLMTMIMTPIATRQRLLSQARFLRRSSLSQQLASCWEHGSLRLCPEMAGKTHFEGALPWNGFLKFQAFRSPWDKVVPQHGGPAGRWQLVPLGSLKVRKEDGRGWWPQAWHVCHRTSSCLQEISFLSVLCLAPVTPSVFSLVRTLPCRWVKNSSWGTKLKWPLCCRLTLRPLCFDCTVCAPAHLFSWFACAYFWYAYFGFLQK